MSSKILKTKYPFKRAHLTVHCQMSVNQNSVIQGWAILPTPHNVIAIHDEATKQDYIIPMRNVIYCKVNEVHAPDLAPVTPESEPS